MFCMKVIKNKKYAYFSVAAMLAGTLAFLFPPRIGASNAAEYTGDGTNPATGEWTWQVNVQEVLNVTVTVTDPGEEGWAEGDVDTFLRNKVHVKVTSNNAKGFTAGMTTKETHTNLTNAAASTTLPTLTGSAKCTGTADANCAAFVANHWGYSLDDTDDGKAGTYNPLVGSAAAPITVLSSKDGSPEKDIFFGAKADKTQASGTYAGTVVFTVTSGTNGEDLPGSGSGDQPLPGPSADDPAFSPTISEAPSSNSAPTYTYTTNNRTYRSTATSVATVADDQQPRKTSNEFVSPLGVNRTDNQTITNIQHGSIITTVLMVVALVTAAIGIFFFILARRRDREEEEDIQEV